MGVALWAAWNPYRESLLYPPPEAVMYRCTVCHFDVELDDVVIAGGTRACICLRCWERETKSEKPMDKRLRQQVMQALSEGPR